VRKLDVTVEFPKKPMIIGIDSDWGRRFYGSPNSISGVKKRPGNEIARTLFYCEAAKYYQPVL